MPQAKLYWCPQRCTRQTAHTHRHGHLRHTFCLVVKQSILLKLSKQIRHALRLPACDELLQHLGNDCFFRAFTADLDSLFETIRINCQVGTHARLLVRHSTRWMRSTPPKCRRHTARRASSAHTPAAKSNEPPTVLNLRCARGEARRRRVLAAKRAYRVALMMAMHTNVAASTQSCKAMGPPGVVNCGRKATKNTMPLGLSAVTSQVLTNRHQRGRLG